MVGAVVHLYLWSSSLPNVVRRYLSTQDPESRLSELNGAIVELERVSSRCDEDVADMEFPVVKLNSPCAGDAGG